MHKKQIITLCGLLAIATSAAAWTHSGGGTMVESDGSALLTFAPSGFSPPATCTISQTVLPGEYDLAGIRIGTESGRPISVQLTIEGNGTACSRYMTDMMPEVGAEKTMVFEPSTPNWSGDTAALVNPQTIAVFIRQGSTNAESYRIEALFCALRPQGHTVRQPRAEPSSPASLTLVWSRLNDQLCYRVLRSTNLVSGAWQEIEALDFPTEEVLSRTLSNEEQQGFYKMKIMSE